MARQRSYRRRPTTDKECELCLRVAQAFIIKRDVRDEILGADLFADPAWDLLLELYVAKAEDRALTIGEACIGARVSPTTGLRWIGELERAGCIEKVVDRVDRRRTFLQLTDRQTEALDHFFRSAAGILQSLTNNG